VKPPTWTNLPKTGHLTDYRPPRDLEPYVRNFWLYRAGECSTLERTLPDNCVNLMVQLSHEPPPRTIVCGADRSYREIELAAGTVIVGVRFRPGVTAALFDVSPGEITGRTVALADVAPGFARSVARSPLHDCGPNVDAERLCDALVTLVRGLVARSDSSATARRVREALHCMARYLTAPIPEIARLVGRSERSLHREFQTSLGLSPKMVARVLRLQRAARGVTRESLAALAAEVGYSDQAHMTREFVSLTGFTPKELRVATTVHALRFVGRGPERALPQ
jgi:AraC-like DNA-binding protein